MTEQATRAEAVNKLGEIIKRKALELRSLSHSMHMLADMGEPIGKTVAALRCCAAAEEVRGIVAMLEPFLATPAKTREREKQRLEAEKAMIAACAAGLDLSDPGGRDWPIYRQRITERRKSKMGARGGKRQRNVVALNDFRQGPRQPAQE